MKSKSRNRLTVIASAVILCVWCAGISAKAESSNSRCKQAKGRWLDIYPGSGAATFGNITQAGWLDGSTQTVFTSAAFPTPVASTVSFTADSTITTVHGQLKTNNVYLYDFPTGLFTLIARINGGASTGRFAGATGAFFTSGRSPDGLTYPGEITGEVCVVKD